MSPESTFRIGIDTGGTFTDFVVIRNGNIEIFKELSTPHHPEEAIVKGLARRAHHSDVGGMTPGSMPLAEEIYQEGLRIPPINLMSGGKLNSDIWDLILSNVRTPKEREGDLAAMLGANRTGERRLMEIVQKHGWKVVRHYLEETRTQTTVLSDRRTFQPYGLNGGEAGQPGLNILIRSDGKRESLPSKFTMWMESGSILSIQTPGGGGWGKA